MSTYNLSPSKAAYQAIKADVTPVSAFKELVDNAIDNWQRVLDGLDPLTVEIEYYPEGPDQDRQVVVRDDSGGLEEEDVNILFALGLTKKDQIPGAIGAYGIGAKKAIINLGNEAIVKSRHHQAEQGFGFRIDEDWLEDDGTWEVEKMEFGDLEAGVTEIIIRDLNNSWEKYRDKLVEDLGETYQYFLDPKLTGDRETIEIVVREFDRSGDVESEHFIEAAEGVDWSFTPMDGLFPRRYEGIELEARGSDEVKLNVTVGLLRQADVERAGADIFCQGRKVLTAVRDERAGFGTGAGSSRLGKFSGQHRRLRVIIEFKTEGDAQVLPWDAQKSDIDPYNRVAQAAQDWVRRIVKPYYEAAGAYDEIPSAVLTPYDRDNPHAVTQHLEDPYDYSGSRERVSHKPDTGFKDARAISDRADVSAALQVYSPGDLDEALVPAYRSDLARLLNTDHGIDVDPDDLPSEVVPEVELPEGFTTDQAASFASELRAMANSHARREPPVRNTGLPAWQQPAYDHALRRALSERGIDTALEDLHGVEEEGPDVEVTEEAPEHEGGKEETEDAEPALEGQQDAGIDDFSVGAIGSERGEPESASGRSLHMSDDQWEELVTGLGLPEDASDEEVVDELLEVVQVVGMLKA